MTARFNGRHTRRDRFRTTDYEPAIETRGFAAMKPDFVFFGCVDGAVECLRPFYMRGVEVGVGDYDGFQAAHCFDLWTSCQFFGMG